MQPQTERYLDLAQTGQNRWWRYLIALPLLVVLTIAAMYVLLIGFAGIVGVLSAAGLLPGIKPEQLEMLGTGTSGLPMLEFIGLNLSVISMLVALALVVKFVHRRTVMSVITPAPSIDWRRILQGAAVWVVLAGVFSLVEHLMFPGRYRITFDAARFLPFLVATFVLTPWQCATEELVFRGYLMQGLGSLVRNPIFVAVVSSALFASLHLWNPEVGRYGFWLMAANYFLMGLFLASLALRDGRLELAIGAHTGNNMMSALVTNNDGSVFETPSIFTSPMDPVFALVSVVFAAIVFHLVVFGLPGSTRQPVSGS